ncbi:uncharacterized protein LOC132171594 [Corylus avellana]|uniref:uncharacterized protein LOC132171594 n=1 Tax=Corylus avellana TaxID=13451 RepID=UPI001E210790|nr:uncharacterized protein LOC132171594 [Corylus avellana]
MDSQRVRPEAQAFSPSGSGRRSNCSASPEFEFWMIRNPSFPQPNLVSADELFVDGVLLPLRLLPQPDPSPEPPNANPDPEPPNKNPDPGPPESAPFSITESIASFSGSKRWRDIFKKSSSSSSTKSPEEKDKEKEKEKEKKKAEKERKGGSGASSAELNINIWPFSRSRSAGNANTRPKSGPGAPGTRKVNSAPCSRSNSAGESKSRKWPSSPGRAGVHLGRSSPVWHVRRGGASALKSSEPVVRFEKGSKKDVPDTRRGRTAAKGVDGAPKARVLNLNVPMCIGYKHHLSCRSDENSAVNSGGAGGINNNRKIIDNGGGSANVGNGGNIFSLKSLFTKKVY